MAFTPDTDTNYQAYLFARNKLPGWQAQSAYDAAFIQFLCLQMTNAATLVTNSGTAAAPNGTVATAITDANASLYNRNF